MDKSSAIGNCIALSMVFSVGFTQSAYASDKDALIQYLDGSEWEIVVDVENPVSWDRGNHTCENPVKFKVSDDGGTITISSGRTSFVTQTIEILPSTRSILLLRIQYKDEKRLGPDNKPIRWVLNMTEPNEFVWHLSIQKSDGFFDRSQKRRSCASSIS